MADAIATCNARRSVAEGYRRDGYVEEESYALAAWHVLVDAEVVVSEASRVDPGFHWFGHTYRDGEEV